MPVHKHLIIRAEVKSPLATEKGIRKITINKTTETERVMINAPKNLTIDFLGSLTRDDVIAEISKSKFLIFPSSISIEPFTISSFNINLILVIIIS